MEVVADETDPTVLSLLLPYYTPDRRVLSILDQDANLDTQVNLALHKTTSSKVAAHALRRGRGQHPGRTQTILHRSGLEGAQGKPELLVELVSHLDLRIATRAMPYCTDEHSQRALLRRLASLNSLKGHAHKFLRELGNLTWAKETKDQYKAHLLRLRMEVPPEDGKEREEWENEAATRAARRHEALMNVAMGYKERILGLPPGEGEKVGEYLSRLEEINEEVLALTCIELVNDHKRYPLTDVLAWDISSDHLRKVVDERYEENHVGAELRALLHLTLRAAQHLYHDGGKTFAKVINGRTVACLASMTPRDKTPGGADSRILVQVAQSVSDEELLSVVLHLSREGEDGVAARALRGRKIADETTLLALPLVLVLGDVNHRTSITRYALDNLDGAQMEVFLTLCTNPGHGVTGADVVQASRQVTR